MSTSQRSIIVYLPIPHVCAGLCHWQRWGAGMGMVTILAFFHLPNGMTSFLANIASVLDAVAVEVVCVSVCVAVHPGELQCQIQIPKVTPMHHGTMLSTTSASTTATSCQRATLMAMADQQEMQAQTKMVLWKTWVLSMLLLP